MSFVDSKGDVNGLGGLDGLDALDEPKNLKLNKEAPQET